MASPRGVRGCCGWRAHGGRRARRARWLAGAGRGRRRSRAVMLVPLLELLAHSGDVRHAAATRAHRTCPSSTSAACSSPSSGAGRRRTSPSRSSTSARSTSGRSRCMLAARRAPAPDARERVAVAGFGALCPGHGGRRLAVSPRSSRALPGFTPRAEHAPGRPHRAVPRAAGRLGARRPRAGARRRAARGARRRGSDRAGAGRVGASSAGTWPACASATRWRSPGGSPTSRATRPGSCARPQAALLEWLVLAALALALLARPPRRPPGRQRVRRARAGARGRRPAALRHGPQPRDPARPRRAAGDRGDPLPPGPGPARFAGVRPEFGLPPVNANLAWLRPLRRARLRLSRRAPLRPAVARARSPPGMPFIPPTTQADTTRRGAARAGAARARRPRPAAAGQAAARARAEAGLRRARRAHLPQPGTALPRALLVDRQSAVRGDDAALDAVLAPGVRPAPRRGGHRARAGHRPGRAAGAGRGARSCAYDPERRGLPRRARGARRCSSCPTCTTPAGRRRSTAARRRSSASTTCCAACACPRASTRVELRYEPGAGASAGSSRC